ncbi:MAG: hypothetical protein KC503_36415 [Myxococcales bacterium]|nr:hypothetical protein [Myxococcales bacterium]
MLTARTLLRPSKSHAAAATLFAVILLAASACSDDSSARNDAGADVGAKADSVASADVGASADSTAGDSGASSDSTPADQSVPADASPTATHYLFWQSPGGFARTGPAIEIFGDGRIRFWKQVKEQAPQQTMGWDQEVVTSPGFVYPLFKLLQQADFSKLPHKSSPQAECWPSLYWRECFSCKAVTIDHNKVSGLRPELDAVLQWLDANLKSKSESPLPSEFCFGA